MKYGTEQTVETQRGRANLMMNQNKNELSTQFDDNAHDEEYNRLEN